MSTIVTVDGRPVDEARVAAFRNALTGPVFAAGDEGYDAARQIWNGLIDRRPGLIARCAGIGDVQRAVRFAREENVLLSVRGGGHNVAGSALCDGGLTIDLTRFKDITVDGGRRTASAGAGLSWGEFDRETQRVGLATTGGAVSTTGIAGLTLGGGLGWLMGRYGYTVDNLLSADVVLADASRVTASESSHPELFWALRGGGGNFGVVTSFEYRLHDVGPVLAGLIAHPLDRLPELLRVYREFVSSAPDALTAHAAILTLPTGDRVAAILPVWSGELAEGERRLEPLRRFGPPVLDALQPMPYVAVQSMLDAAAPYGRHNYWKSSFLRDLDADAAGPLLDHSRRMPSPYSFCLIEHVHGAPTRVAADATAFGVRDEHFHFIAVASWDPAGDAGPHMAWCRSMWQAMQPWSAHRVYANILGHDEQARIREAYGPNYRRLATVKAQYDPANLFRVNQNIVPEAAQAG